MKLLILIIAFCNLSFAQTTLFSVKSLNNNTQFQITMREELLNNMLKIFLWNKGDKIDSLKIENILGLQNITLLSPNFLEINVFERGGSNLRIIKTVLFTVINNRLIESLSLITERHYKISITYNETYDKLKGIKEEEKYRIIIKPIIGKEGNLKLSLNESYSYYLANDTSKNVNEAKNFILLLNKSYNVFYNCQSKLGNLIKHENDGKMKNNVFPCIKLLKQKLLYSSNHWYDLD